MLSQLDLALVAALTLVLMVGMGTSLTPQDFRRVTTRPRGVLVGLCSQFGWMPLICALLLSVFPLTDELAFGLLLMACCAGGTVSNTFTYFSQADLALSISMTSLSTVAAVGMTPLLLSLYAPALGIDGLGVPYGMVALTLAGLLVPVAAGMALRHYRPGLAHRTERVGSVCGVLMLGMLMARSFRDYMDWFASMGANMLITSLGTALGGMTLGYLAARRLGLNQAERRAVMFETGAQNTPMAISVVVAAFAEERREELLRMPLLYAALVLVMGSLLTLALRAHDRRLATG